MRSKIGLLPLGEIKHRSQAQQRKEIMKALITRPRLAALAATPLMAAAVALAICTAIQPAEAASAGSSNNEYAVGGTSFMPGHLAFAAQKNPQNGSVTGYVVQEDAMGNSFSGKVECLTTLNGNMAHVVWRIAHTDNPGLYPVGQQRQFDVTDNGQPMMGMPTDQFADQGPCGMYSQPTCNCSKVCSGGAYPARGNIVVKGPSTM